MEAGHARLTGRGAHADHRPAFIRATAISRALRLCEQPGAMKFGFTVVYRNSLFHRRLVAIGVILIFCSGSIWEKNIPNADGSPKYESYERERIPGVRDSTVSFH